ncbi:unnamed protein product [Effrenium voratum]|nr:unnamed protein product [Effrenium voratum]
MAPWKTPQDFARLRSRGTALRQQTLHAWVALARAVCFTHGEASERDELTVDRWRSVFAMEEELRTRDAEQSLLDAAEVARSRSNIQRARGQDKDLLEEAYKIQEESRMEEENAQGVAAAFAATLQQFNGQSEGASSCSGLVCGGNGYCDEDSQGARCKCKAGYQGTGFVCNPAAGFAEHPLISAAGAKPTQVADLHVSSLSGNGVAVAFRDPSRRNRGFVVLGTALDGGMRWSAPALISASSPVFGPVLVELDQAGGLAVAYRTKDRGGDGMLLCGRRDAENRVQLGPARVFSHYQAQAMTLIALPQNRVAVLFSEHQPVTGAEAEHFGTSLLAEMSDSKDAMMPKLLGKYHFAKGAVTRITAAPLSSKTFAIAFRQSRESAAYREASVSLAELWGTELVFTTSPTSLEPGRGQIWARSVAGLGDGAFAYTYHSGAEQVTKQAVLRLHPQSHRLEMLQEPQVVAEGFSPFVSTVSTVHREVHQFQPQRGQRIRAEAQPQGHRFFTFIGGEGAKGRGRLCGVSAGLPDRCQDVGASSKEVLSVASALLSDGRVFLLTSSASGTPHYALVGLGSA